jgi:hypothetical protein
MRTPVSATAAQFHTTNGQKYMCFFVYFPAASQYMWCLPASDPAAAFTAGVVNAAAVKGKTISVGCSSCLSMPGDAKFKDTMWVPEYVFVDEGDNRVQ